MKMPIGSRPFPKKIFVWHGIHDLKKVTMALKQKLSLELLEENKYRISGLSD
jgi:hypothetical protein